MSIISLYGAYAAQNAILRASGVVVSINSNGFDALNGAEIIHDDSGTCTIECDSNGCDNAILTCDGTSCDWNINCNSTLKTDLCPNGYELPYNLSLPSLKDVEFSTYDNSYTTCDTSTTNALNCDDYRSSTCYNNGALTENDPICCTAYYSCRYATSMTASVDTGDVDIYETAFRADGYYSAEDTSGTISAPNGGNMYFSGSDANQDSSIITTISNNGNYDIIASGQDSLQYKIITNARNLYALGDASMQYAEISSINNGIYAYALESLQYSTISNVLGDIHCGSSNACRQIDANNISGNIIGVGINVLYNSSISNVNGTVLAYGFQALYSATVRNVKNVCK